MFEDGYLFCPKGSVIHVLEAIYGRIDGGNQCGGANACASRKSFMSIFNHMLFINNTHNLCDIRLINNNNL